MKTFGAKACVVGLPGQYYQPRHVAIADSLQLGREPRVCDLLDDVMFSSTFGKGPFFVIFVS